MPVKRAPAVALLLALASCREVSPPQPAAPAAPTVRLVPPADPEAKLDARFRRDLLPAVRRETTLRLVVDLVEQRDLAALAGEAAARGLSRERRKAHVADALAAPLPAAAALAAELRGRPDVADVVTFRCVSRVAFTGPARLARELALRDEVAWAWGRDLSVAGAPMLPDDRPPGRGTAWGPVAMRAPAAWARGLRGEGAHACVLDSGPAAGAPLPPALAGRRVSAGPRQELPDEGRGHGLAVAGAATGGEGIGVAPGARWSIANPLAGGVLDPEAFATVIDGLLAHARPDVVIVPWDVPAGDLPAYHLAIPFGALRSAGMAVAFPAGNTGPTAGANRPPANLTGLAPDGAPAFSVGGVDEELRAYEASNRGPNANDGSTFPLAVAPAVDVSVIDPATGELRAGHGTSYAVGFAGGALAVLLGADPGLTGPEAEALLRRTARDLGAPGPDDTFGAGLIDVEAAVSAPRTPAPPGASARPSGASP